MSIHNFIMSLLVLVKVSWARARSFYSNVIILCLAFLLLGCASGGGGDSTSAGIFSHSQYSYIVQSDTPLTDSGNNLGQGVILGMVSLKRPQVENLVAAALGVSDPEEIS